VRMHSAARTAMFSAPPTCDCGILVRNSLRAIAAEGLGVLVYLHESGPGFRTERDAYGQQRIAVA